MTTEPLNSAQLALLIGAIALFLGGAGFSIAQFRLNRRSVRIAAKAMDYWAILFTLAVLIWHATARTTGSWLPLEDNFETLAALAVLLAVFSMYMQFMKPIPGLDWFLLPIVVLLLIAAAIFGRLKPNTLHPGGWWTWTHIVSSFGGAAAFAVAAAVGCVYLLLSARLRRKSATPVHNLGSLERLERISESAVWLGFGLLTLAMITGLIRVLHDGPNAGLGEHWMRSPKVILATCVWIVYGLALHTPMHSVVRGRRSAVLSIVGFALMFGTLIAVQFMPKGQ